MGSNTVFDEETSLVLCLREIFDHNAWTDFQSKLLDECHNNYIIFLVS